MTSKNSINELTDIDYLANKKRVVLISFINPETKYHTTRVRTRILYVTKLQ
jgi:hypothetical protein